MSASRPPIPVVAHTLGERERAAAAAVLAGEAITTGPQAHAFEADLAAWTGTDTVLAVNSCTAALHLALLACDLGPGDEVITSPVTFPATINVIRLVGATPVLADVDPVTLNLDPAAVARAITPRTRAILPVHMGGVACDMHALGQIADAHGLRTIADAAHAIDTRHAGAHVADLGDLCAFSFYATKNMTTVEGGALCGDPSLVERARTLSRHGLRFDWGPDHASVARGYEPAAPGLKYNMTDVAAAIGRVQLDRLPDLQRRRRSAAAAYDAALDGHPSLAAPPGAAERDDQGLYLYQAEVRRPEDRPALCELLADAGVTTGFYYTPLHHYALYANAARGPLPGADRAVGRFVALPMHAALDDRAVARVVAALAATRSLTTP